MGRSAYRVGALSRSLPIEVVGRYVEGFAHGALHFRVGGWHFVVTHLTPHGGKEGLAEVVVLLGLLGKGEPHGPVWTLRPALSEMTAADVSRRAI
jgi:hypothetical protein